MGDDFGKVVGTPTGYGDYTTVIPCPVCGGSSLLLFEESVECSNCFNEREQVEVVLDAAAQFDIAMNLLGEIVRTTEGSEARQLLRDRLGLWGLTLALWEARTV